MTVFDNGLQSISLSDHERTALAELAEFPLYEAIIGRRSRRFPVGGEIPDGVLAYTSSQASRPLTDLQRALVLATVTGQTGWHFGITRHPGYQPQFPNYSGSAIGRTFPSAAGFHTTQFFFTDDSGTYYLPTRDQPLEHSWEGVNPAETDQVEAALNAVLARAVKLNDERLYLPRQQPYFEGHNTWIGNWPGSLLVIPVADLAQQTLLNIAFFSQNGYVLFDDINDRPIPGLQKFEHRLDHFDDPQPLSFVEQYSLAEASAELMTSSYVGHLALGAIGLGGGRVLGNARRAGLGGSGVAPGTGVGFRYPPGERGGTPHPTRPEGGFRGFPPARSRSMTQGVRRLAGGGVGG
uniref:hypothetical protein n=1 Tax=Auritidibacter ignavus TaxID=678932 RepID=UPI00109D0942